MHPLLLLGLMTAASTGANYMAQKKVDKARGRAMEADRKSREAASKKAFAAQESTLDLLAKTAADQKTREAELAEKYKSAAPVQVPVAAPQTPSQALGAGSESTATIEAGSRQAARAKEYTGQQALARAAMNSFGDVMVDTNIAAGKNENAIRRAGIQASDYTRNVLPLKLNAANQAGNTWGTIGDVIQLASAIYGPIGLSKGGGGLAKAFDVSTRGGGGAASALRYV